MIKKTRTKRLFLISLVVLLSGLAAPFTTKTETALAYTYFIDVKTEKDCVAAGGKWDRDQHSSWCEGKSTPAQNAKMLLSAGWITGCIQQQGANLSAEDLQNYQLSPSNSPKQIIGHVVDQADGVLDCGNTGNVRSRLSDLGYTDFLVFLKFIGCTEADTELDCIPARDLASKDPKAFLAKIITVIPETGLDKTVLTGADRYYIALNTFKVGCKATKIANPSEADKKAADTTDNTYRITEVDANGVKTEAFYKAELGKGHDVSTVNSSLGWDTDGMFSCESLAGMTGSVYATAYQSWVKANPTLAKEMEDIKKDEGPAKTTCAIDGIGWIMCPVMDFMAKVVDGAYGVVGGLLKTPPINTNSTDSTNGTYQAWAVMRTIANVAFVIAFLIIIFSQLTSVGITNYGVKKMLPRIVIAAILVNLSYFICAIAVDLSNIAGSSMTQVFDSLNGNITGEISSPNLNNGATQTGKGWAGIVAALLAGGAALYAGLSVLLPALIAALVAIVTVFLVLTLRQALIIILIVISPLAFVAFLLPNTEDLFKKWRKLLTTLLLMFPIIALIFGGSALASKIIMASDTASFAVQVMGALVAIIPLFITPIVMKTAGGLLNRFGGFVNNPNKGPFDRMRKGAEGYRNNRQEYRKLKSLNGYRSLPGVGRFSRQKASRDAVLNNRKNELSLATADYVADRATTDDKFRGKLAQGGGNGADMRALAGAINVQVELKAKEVKAASAVIENMNLDSEQLNNLAKGGEGKSKDGRSLSGKDDSVRKAAIMSAVSIGTVKDVEEIIKSAGSMSSEQHKILGSAVASSGITNKATHLAGQTLDDIAQGNITSEADLDMVTARAIQKGKYSAEKLADSDPDSLKRVISVLAQPRTDMDTEHITSIHNEAERAATDSRISGRLTVAQKPQLNQLRTSSTPTAPVPPPSPSNGMLLSPNETVAIDDRAAAINASNQAQQDALSQGYSAVEAQRMGDAVYKNHPDIK